MTEQEKLNAYCFALIKICLSTNAEKMKITQENVVHLGTQLGNWKITVEKI